MIRKMITILKFDFNDERIYLKEYIDIYIKNKIFIISFFIMLALILVHIFIIKSNFFIITLISISYAILQLLNLYAVRNLINNTRMSSELKRVIDKNFLNEDSETKVK